MIRIGLLCAALGCGESKPLPTFRCYAPYFPVCVNYSRTVSVRGFDDREYPVVLVSQLCECVR